MTEASGSGLSEPDHTIVVIGAGLSGLGAAMKLRRAGIRDFVIIERGSDVGGTWRDKTYPGVAVDAPSFNYQYPFELNPEWASVFPRGAEVKAYIDGLVERYRLRTQLQLNTEVLKMDWDEAAHLWRCDIGSSVLTARFVIAAYGVFTRPKLPDIPGLAEFTGTTMHTARWDHECDVTGKRVAVIGTGDSAIRTRDGGHREVDVLVLATGFLFAEPENAPPIPIHGRDDLNLRRFWSEHRKQAYESVSVPKVPTAFLILGPYSLTTGSWMPMIETSTQHAMRVIREAIKRGATHVEIRQEPHDAFFRDILARMANTPLTPDTCGKSNSYFFDANGDATAIRPATYFETYWRSRHFNLDHYHYRQ